MVWRGVFQEQMEAGVDRMDNIGSVGRASKVVRRLRKAGEFLIIVNLQVLRATYCVCFVRWLL